MPESILLFRDRPALDLSSEGGRVAEPIGKKAQVSMKYDYFTYMSVLQKLWKALRGGAPLTHRAS